MAKGRFVSKQITIDKKVNDLKDPWSMLGFTWMIPHADCEGRLYGDPSVLKSIIFPRQNGNISVDEVEKMACDWHNAGLVIYYEDDCDRYIQLVNFEKHQSGLRKDREPASAIPCFNPETCRIIAGLNRVKLSEVKLNQDKPSESDEDLFSESSKLSELSKTFEVETKMPVRYPEKWMTSIRNMFEAGVTPQMLKDTIYQMKNPQKGGTVLTIGGPWSCEGMAIDKTITKSGPDMGLRN
jgi:hypothetical protein